MRWSLEICRGKFTTCGCPTEWVQKPTDWSKTIQNWSSHSPPWNIHGKLSWGPEIFLSAITVRQTSMRRSCSECAIWFRNSCLSIPFASLIQTAFVDSKPFLRRTQQTKDSRLSDTVWNQIYTPYCEQGGQFQTLCLLPLCKRLLRSKTQRYACIL